MPAGQMQGLLFPLTGLRQERARVARPSRARTRTDTCKCLVARLLSCQVVELK